MDTRHPISRPLFEAIEIKHGPVNLLQRFFSWADAAARERGVALRLASFAELASVNRANSDTWRPLFPLFDIPLGGADDRAGFVILGYDRAGDVVATQAARFYEWTNTDLYTEAVSLRMFYTDPTAAFVRGDICTIATNAAHNIAGRVVFSGAGWYRPDFRGKGLATLIPRISRAYAFTRWDTDFTISMMADAVMAGGMADRTGYTNVAPSSVELVVSPFGSMRCALVWMETKQLISDLDAIMVGGQQSNEDQCDKGDDRLVRNLLTSVDEGNWPAVAHVLHNDIICEHPGHEPIVGKKAVLDFYRLNPGVPLGTHHIERVVKEGSHVACWGNFSGHARDGRDLRARFIDIYYLRDGLIGFRRTYFDSLSS